MPCSACWPNDWHEGSGKDCKEQYTGTKEEYEEMRLGYGPEFWDKLAIPMDNTFRLSRGKGCETCNRTGFKGRVALHNCF